MTIFQLKNFVSSAGLELDWKVECDSLTQEDWETIAKIGARNLPAFRAVDGVPRGGNRLAEAMQKYTKSESGLILVVDDVYTTGRSIAKYMTQHAPEVMGFVAFARSEDAPLPLGIKCFALLPML